MPMIPCGAESAVPVRTLFGFSLQEWEIIGVWVGSIGATGAFIVAFALALGGRARDRKLAERDQASRVSAWLDIGDVKGEPRVRIHAKNGSSAQINDFKCIVIDTIDCTMSPTTVWLPGLAPSGEPIIYALDVELPSHLQQYRYELSFEFTDVQNRRWGQTRGKGLVLLTRSAEPISYGSDGRPLGELGA